MTKNVLLIGTVMLCSGWQATLPASEPAKPTFVELAETASAVQIDVKKPLEPVNRRVMGVCLIYPPFNQTFIDKVKPLLAGTSGRAWAGYSRKGQDNETWMGSFRLARAAGLRELNAFNPEDHINRPARYVSPSDNNLDPHHQPAAVAQFLLRMNTEPATDLPDGAGITGWEVWNEPQFPQNGAWPAEDFARYTLDVSRAVRAAGLRIEIGVPMHEDDLEWNRRMLSFIAREDPSAINFVLTHPYDFSWIRKRKEMGEYYARMAAADMMKARKLAPKQALVAEIGNHRWRLVASEWNIHPEGFTPPFRVSTDMVAAVHMAAMFGVFWDLNIDSAQFFQLRRENEGHFAMFVESADGIKPVPTGEVFRLYSEHFWGDRLEANLVAPSFPHEYLGVEVSVPIVFAQSCFDAAAQNLVVFLGNRHQSKEAPVEIRLKNFKVTDPNSTAISITAREPDLTEVDVTKAPKKLPVESDPLVKVTLPPHSVTALLIKGTIPPTQEELFAGRQKFIRTWKVGTICDPEADSKSGLEKPALPEELAFDKTVEIDSSGFVNIGELLRVSGRVYNLKDGFRATAQCWVFSPVEREVGISCGFDYRGRVSLGGGDVLDVSNREGPAAPDTHRAKMKLASGWNELQVRTSSGSSGMGFWFAIEDPGDLAFATEKSDLVWPRELSIRADQCAGVNSWEKAKDVPLPDEPKLTLAGQGNIRRAFVKWPTIKIPEGLKLKSAEIVLTQAFQREGEKAKVFIAPADAAWEEATLTHATQPKRGAFVGLPAMVVDKEWSFSGNDVTALVRRWIENPNLNFGICVSSDIIQYAAFFSDDTPAQAPKLILQFE